MSLGVVYGGCFLFLHGGWLSFVEGRGCTKLFVVGSNQVGMLRAFGFAKNKVLLELV